MKKSMKKNIVIFFVLTVIFNTQTPEHIYVRESDGVLLFVRKWIPDEKMYGDYYVE